MHTLHGYNVNILSEKKNTSLQDILQANRPYSQDPTFFSPQISQLHDPYLLPDMEVSVNRILEARKKKERIVIFGDYDVDGVSSTAILVRFLTEIGCHVSYRLPHRVHDGYGLKDYFFDELSSKQVSLVITVDCGTRDIGPIQHAHSLGIDVIVTDHHAVPDIVPTEVIGIINPKRKDSLYPFGDLAGAGVAFKLIQGILMMMQRIGKSHIDESKELERYTDIDGSNWIGSCIAMATDINLYAVLMRYTDFASLGTVSDCMPIVGENRIITTLGLAQMRQSSSSGLRKFLEGRERVTENDADLIGFQVGPRINAAGRMDTPITALRWLLASDERADGFFSELEHLNTTRKGTTEAQLEQALTHVDTSLPILFYDADNLEHGIIGLVAGKLTEMYGKPSIIIKNGHNHPLTRHKGDDIMVNDSPVPSQLIEHPKTLSVASCRSPDWCNMIELLDGAKDLFVRYGGHKQAAGFTIEQSKIGELKRRLIDKLASMHDIHNLPKRILDVECILGTDDLVLKNIDAIDRFRPFGIGNRKPLFLLQDETILEAKPLGKEGRHLEIRLEGAPGTKLVAWGWGETGEVGNPPMLPGDIVSLIVELDRNEWNGRESVSVIVKDLII